MIVYLGMEAGLHAFIVTTTSKHDVHICPHTGEAWCDCHDFFYRQQAKGQPTIASKNVCKHIRAVMSELA